MRDKDEMMKTLIDCICGRQLESVIADERILVGVNDTVIVENVPVLRCKCGHEHISFSTMEKIKNNIKLKNNDKPKLNYEELIKS